MFYIVRLFIYNTEAGDKNDIEKEILRKQFSVMLKRLWYSITWPSAILTLIFGLLVMFLNGWNKVLFQEAGKWLLIKLIFVFFLYLYFLSLHKIFKQQMQGIFKYTSQQLRIWNELATIFLIAIVMLAVVKNSLSVVWGLIGLFLFIIVLM
ncbi:MAG: CopD family protein, partial [Thermoproteota archaeon]|nr:CopD family protein [Thermoproteota archaeon]